MKKLIVLLFLLVFSQNLFAQVLMLYGGDNNEIFIGCLNTNKFDNDSIWNQFGDYGSKFSSDSIWNQFGTYGSKFNTYSPWNQFSTNAPGIVDEDGNFYGYMSINKFHPKRTEIEWILWIIDNYEWIQEDVGKAYDTIFN